MPVAGFRLKTPERATCVGCGVDKPQEDFYRHSQKPHLLLSRCKPCRNRIVADKARTNRSPEALARQREAARWHIKKKTYGIDQVTFQRMLNAQNGGCALCGDQHGDGRRGSLAVDHCHETDAVRGLLCARCNTGLGGFRDRPDLLLRAIQYLASGVDWRPKGGDRDL